jgi:hypothetical protein
VIKRKRLDTRRARLDMPLKRRMKKARTDRNTVKYVLV